MDQACRLNCNWFRKKREITLGVPSLHTSRALAKRTGYEKDSDHCPKAHIAVAFIMNVVGAQRLHDTIRPDHCPGRETLGRCEKIRRSLPSDCFSR